MQLALTDVRRNPPSSYGVYGLAGMLCFSAKLTVPLAGLNGGLSAIPPTYVAILAKDCLLSRDPLCHTHLNWMGLI